MTGHHTSGLTSAGKARRGVLLAMAVVLVTACAGSTTPGPAPAGGASSGGAQEELVVINYGGTFEKYWTEDIIQPFEKEHNVKVTQVSSLTMDTLAKMRAQKDNPQIDVVMMADQGSVIANTEGLFEPLDESKIPNMKELVPPPHPAARGLARHAASPRRLGR